MMNVIEFFTIYWDWYIFIGAMAVLSGFANGKFKECNSPWTIALFLLIFWPPRLMSVILRMDK